MRSLQQLPYPADGPYYADDRQRAIPYAAPVAEPDGMDLFRKLWRRKGTIVLATMAGAVVATGASALLTPRYTSESRVMVGIETPNVVNVPAVLRTFAADQEAVQSEGFVLQSRTLAQEVARRLALEQDPEFNPALRPKPFWRDYLDSAKAFVKKDVMEGLFGVASGDALASGLTEEQRRRMQEDIVVDHLLLRLDVEPLRRSHVLAINASSESPYMAARIADTVANTYIEQQLIRRARATQRATDWLDKQIVELRTQVEASERAVQEYRRKHGLYETKSDLVTAQQVAELNTQLILAESEKAAAEARLGQVEAVARNQAPPDSLPDVVKSPLITALTEKRVEVDRSFAELSSTYGPNHPRMRDIRAQRADVRSKLAAEVRKIVEATRHETRSAQARYQSLRRSLDNLQNRLGQVNETAIKLHELERQAEANRKLLTNFLERSKETGAQPNIDQPPAEVISRATIPLKPSFPPSNMIVLLGTVGGSLIGMLLALLRENLDHTFRTSRQVEEATGLPSLAVIPPPPRVGPFDTEEMLARSDSLFNQAIRGLGSRLLIGRGGQPRKVVMFTSATPQEGKSRIAMALAQQSARAGLRVIIVDCDSRRPVIHGLLDRPRSPGLSDLLTGGATPDETVFQDRISGAHAIFAGSVMPAEADPQRFTRLRMLLRTLAKHYDLVVVDAPPVLVGSDTLPLARMVDRVAFVVRWGTVPREVVTDAVRRVIFSGAKLAGCVLSNVDAKRYRRYGMGDAVYPYDRTDVVHAA